MDGIRKVSHEKLVKLAKAAKDTGKFFTAEVVKRTTGEYRILKSVRGGVKVYTNGEGLKFDPDKKGLLVVWESLNPDGDKENLAYRMLNLSGLKALVIEGVRYELA
jgi:hypothetical protein